MVIDSYFYLSFSDAIGLAVTLISVALIVKQLHDSQMASQMSGFLSLSVQFGEIASAIEFIDSLTTSEKWADLERASAYYYLFEDETRKEAYKKVAAFYEVLAALIRRGALDKTLAVDTFGELAVQRWNTVRKAVEFHRDKLGVDELYEQWEWMANNLYKV